MKSIVKRFFVEESGMGVVEVILIIVVLIAMVVIFRAQLTSIIQDIFQRITKDAKGV